MSRVRNMWDGAESLDAVDTEPEHVAVEGDEGIADFGE